tara:strand:- start:48 stop:1070 length:1023 start_codon:yes stop_codon:yes gene_type:complete
MAHMLTTNMHGNVEMAYAGATPWHGLGTDVEGLMTSREALEKAYLDWIVTKELVYQLMNDGTYRAIPSKYATIRNDNELPLGIVGSKYTILDNVDAFAFMDEIVQEGLAMYETCGSMKEGRQIWILAKLPNHVTIGEGDEVVPYLLLTNTHDGSGSVKIMPTFIRVVCNNTLQMALGEGRGSKTIYNIRHTKNMADKVDSARDAIGLINEDFERTKEFYQNLMNVKLTHEELETYFIDAAKLEYNDKGELHPRGQNIVTQLFQNMNHETNLVGNMKNTAWAAYNAFTFWVDHQRCISKTKGLNMTQDQIQTNLSNALMGAGLVDKQKALNLALEYSPIEA